MLLFCKYRFCSFFLTKKRVLVGLLDANISIGLDRFNEKNYKGSTS